MPTYDYQCRSCGSVTEVIHSMMEEGPSICERCGGELRRVLYPTGIIFKGSGFYRTDSRSGASGSSKGEEKGDAKPARGSETNKSSETKKPATETSTTTSSDASKD